ncbi:MAG: Asp-tRNA(Asn)/Glu-tRNA(Gln) amidotransferase subunit GatA [Thermodesulfobacteriota bacterium]
MDWTRLTAHEAHESLMKRSFSSLELAQSFYRRIKSVDSKVAAYLSLTEERAYEQAQQADARIARGEGITELTGIPLALKDILCAKSMGTTCASKILEHFRPPYDATVVRRLRESGAVFLGKVNMDEFAMGSSTENSGFGITRNPWDLNRIPGGSSGGSAAAVAADECTGSLGSDTGGSVRQPAACCGVVGLKPTYGRVSRFGLVAFASSLDQIGPITKDVTDCAILMNAISGHDANDSTSVDIEVPDYRGALINDVMGMKLGIPKEYFVEGMDRDVERAVWEAIKLLEQWGASIEEVSLPHTEYAVATYYIICTAEASSNLARYDGVRYGHRARGYDGLIDMYAKTRAEGFGPEVKRRIMLGTYVLSAGYYDAYYRKAQQVRTLIKGDFDRAFEEYDALLTPTAPTPAFMIGEKVKDPLQMYLSDILTIPANLAGLPGISIPCGLSGGRLPIGLQIIGKHFDEEKILRVAYTYEQRTDWHLKRPQLD